MYGKAQIPIGLWITVLLFILISFLISPNYLLVIPLLFYIPFVFKLFYLRGNPNVLFWGLLYQWLTVAMHPIYCTIKGITLEQYFDGTIYPGPLMNYTLILSIIGLYAMSIGLFFAVRKIKADVGDRDWLKFNPLKVLITYIIVSNVIYVNQLVIWAFPSVVQYFYFFFYIRWGFLLVTVMIIFKNAPHLRLAMIGVILYEFVLGLSSYFASSFSNILLFSLIALAAVSKKISWVKVVVLGVLSVLIFHIAVLWTASKVTYRSYISQGQNVQTVRVSKEEARKKLFELISSVDDQVYQRGIEDLVNRIGYIQYFAACVRFVPAKVPHQDGKVYRTALSHYLVPRFIDPDKPELDDSKHTNEFTGLNVSGKNRASSFSLGTYADAYIDLGPTFMFVIIIAFGFAIGLMYKILFSQGGFWGVLYTAPFFLLVNIFGADTTKAIGFVLIYFLVIYFVKRPLTNLIDPFIRQSLR